MPRGSGIRRCGWCYQTGHNKRTCPKRSPESKARCAKSASKRRCGWCYETGHNLRTCGAYKQTVHKYTEIIGAYRRRLLPLLVRSGLGAGALIAAPGRADRGYVNYEENPYGSSIKGQDVFMINKIDWAQIGPRGMNRNEEFPGQGFVVFAQSVAKRYTDGIERTGWRLKLITDFRCRLPRTSAFLEFCATNSFRPHRLGGGASSWFILSPAPDNFTPPPLWGSALDEETSKVLERALKAFTKEHASYDYSKRPDSSPHATMTKRLDLMHPHYTKSRKKAPLTFSEEVFVREGCEEAMTPYLNAWKSA